MQWLMLKSRRFTNQSEDWNYAVDYKLVRCWFVVTTVSAVCLF